MIILFKGLLILLYIGMIAMNILANSIPFFGRTTGEISAKYPTLFTPSGFTFSIWGIIYVLLAVLVVNLVLMPSDEFAKLSLVFLVSVFVAFTLNGLWLVFWHADRQFLATIIIVGYLIALIIASQTAPDGQVLTRIAIDTNLAWISVATIANVTILLYASNLNLYFSETFYFIAILIVGVILVAFVLMTQGRIVFALVFLWAYFGIFMRYINENNVLLYSLTGVGLIIIASLTAISYFLNNFSLFK